jgi:hypothetical protein
MNVSLRQAIGPRLQVQVFRLVFLLVPNFVFVYFSLLTEPVVQFVPPPFFLQFLTREDV